MMLRSRRWRCAHSHSIWSAWTLGVADSIWEALGNPTSISLKPILTSISKYSSFSSTLIGWARAWLPSRRSTLHQIGAWVSVRLGHWRLGKLTGGKDRYLVTGGACMTGT